MSLKTVTYTPGDCVRCGGADGYEAGPGDTVNIYLNQERIAEFPESIMGTVAEVVQASATDTSRTYTLEYESDHLDGAVTELTSCDITGLTCEGCCDILQRRIDEWEESDEPAVTLAYRISTTGTEPFQLVAAAYARVPGVTIVSYEWEAEGTPFDPSDSETNPVTDIPDSEQTDTGFQGGYYTVTVTDSAGHSAVASVYVNPSRLRIRYATSTLANNASTTAVTLNTGEVLANAVFTTAGSGLYVESITQSGVTATITFSNSNNTGGSLNLGLLIVQSLP